jgi:poly-gamma-glutamate capsule biosynthesis protein CapA/YwtB (metallophosphatase superfamily)
MFPERRPADFSRFIRLWGALLALLLAVLLIGCGRSGEAGAPADATAAPPAQSAAPPASIADTTSERPVRLLFTGDIIPARCVYARQLAAGDFRHAFLKIAPLLGSADITIGSLDASISDAGQAIGCVQTLDLLAPPQTVEGLVYAGFDVLTVATNHIKDCGRAAPACDEALLDTVANLRAAGIATTGAGSNLQEAEQPAVVSVNGTRFAFLGYDDVASYYHAGEDSVGTAGLDASTLREAIAGARRIADVVVVLPHWGTEYTSTPTERQREMARAAVEAGATLVVGNHPHSVQAAEQIDGAFVAYALGNFVFDQNWSPETQEGVILEATFQGPRLVSTNFVPIHIQDMNQPMLAPPDEGRQILDRIDRASQALSQP